MLHRVPRVIFFLLALSLLAASAPAAVTDSSSGGFSVRHTVEIDASAAEVYRALTKQVSRWWHPDHTFSGDAGNLRMEARGGGCFCEKLDGAGEVRHMAVVYADPGKMLRLSGGLGPLQQVAVAGSMTFTLTEAEGKTTLEFTYTVGGYRPGGLKEWAGAVDGVLGIQIQRLERYVETGTPAE
jgi:uncharacterized protein YndB with AHSA1/START domain